MKRIAVVAVLLMMLTATVARLAGADSALPNTMPDSDEGRHDLRGFLDASAEAGPDQAGVEGQSIEFNASGSRGSADFRSVGLVFTKEAGLRVAPGGTYDDGGAFAPDIVRLPNGTYRMYYTGVSGSYRTLSAFSWDGFAWVKEAGVRLDSGGPYDGSAVLYPRVWILGGGTYRMYYTGSDGFSWRILSAVSVDGLTWTKESGIRVDVGGPDDPSRAFGCDIADIGGGLLRMYYSGGTASTYRILSATSSDGLNWTKETGIRVDLSGPLQTNFVASPGVTFYDGGFTRMFYHAYDGAHSRMFSAISMDGLNFAKEPGIRIDNGPTYDSATLGYPEPFWVNGSALRLYYAGYDGSLLYTLSALSLPTRYSLTYSWDFDDRVDSDSNGNATDDGDVTGALAAHAYGDDGLYTVTLTVVDANNSFAYDTALVTVTNAAPSASFSFSPAVAEGSVIQVNVSASDPGSDDLTIQWFWQYGSGGTLTYFNEGSNPDPPNSSAGVLPYSVLHPTSFSYNDDGVYALWINVTDDDGGRTQGVASVSLSNGSPVITALTGPTNVSVSTPVQFEASVTDPGSDDIRFDWDWGEATFNVSVHNNEGLTTDPDPSPWGSAPFLTVDRQTHAWASTGSFRIILLVRDDDGGSVTLSLDVQVHALPPVSTEVQANFKPVVAFAFTIILLVLGIALTRSIDRGSRRTLFATTGIFACAEVVTGVLSIFLPVLAIPPVLGVGTVVDVALLAVGIVALLIFGKRETSPPPPND